MWKSQLTSTKLVFVDGLSICPDGLLIMFNCPEAESQQLGSFSGLTRTLQRYTCRFAQRPGRQFSVWSSLLLSQLKTLASLDSKVEDGSLLGMVSKSSWLSSRNSYIQITHLRTTTAASNGFRSVPTRSSAKVSITHHSLFRNLHSINYSSQ